MLDILIKFIHVLFITAVLVVPFTNNIDYLQFYTVFIPFLFLHWALNDDTCALTVIEKVVTGKTENKETFVGRIIDPIYNMDDSNISKLNKVVAFGLWFFVMFRLNRNTYYFF